jgi:NAD(P)-dependent dehydrogenase (short-subunit alcohol dehydrogenase family)
MATLDDRTWTIGVNLMDVVHGIRAFIARMIEQGRECHVVNTASAAGLVAPPGSSGLLRASSPSSVSWSVCFTNFAPNILKSECPCYAQRLFIPAFPVRKGIDPSHFGMPIHIPGSMLLRLRKAIKSGKLTAADIAKTALDGCSQTQ